MVKRFAGRALGEKKVGINNGRCYNDFLMSNSITERLSCAQFKNDCPSLESHVKYTKLTLIIHWSSEDAITYFDKGSYYVCARVAHSCIITAISYLNKPRSNYFQPFEDVSHLH